MREVEKEITELKNRDYENLTRPVCAFITFEDEDSFIIAQDFEQEFNWLGKPLPAEKKLMEADLFFKEATEPMNIIWENKFFTS